MPQIIIRYNKEAYPENEIEVLGRVIPVFVAEAISVKKYPLTIKNIEWIPQRLEEGSVAPNLRLEIRCAGYLERKKALSEERVSMLKAAIIHSAADHHIEIPFEEPLIWIQYIDPDGAYV
jgi:hypothetical protein